MSQKHKEKRNLKFTNETFAREPEPEIFTVFSDNAECINTLARDILLLLKCGSFKTKNMTAKYLINIDFQQLQ